MGTKSTSCRRGIIAAAVATVVLSATATWANDNSNIGPGLAVISISGSTAIKNMYTAGGNGVFSLEPQNIGTNDSPIWQQTSVTFSNGIYFSAANANGALNLAPTSYSNANLGNGSTGPGLLVEIHESGAVEGIYELAQDQLTPYGYTPPALATSLARFPTPGNPIHINGSGPNVNTSSAGTFSGFVFSANRVQDSVTMAIADEVHQQAFAVTTGGSAPNTSSPWLSVPGQNGYGKGNPNLPTTNALGTPSIRTQLIDNSALIGTPNGTPHNYYNDMESTVINKTATTFAANPGTGLTRLNKLDAQFLESSSRLANGVQFNFTSRDVNSGTHNDAANNIGLDPSWAVGKNDSGSGLLANASDDQTFIGPDLKFSNKTSGGGQLRPTVQNARMAVGTLGQPDVGTRASGAGGTLRVLDYGNALSDGSIAAATNATLPNSVDANGVVVGTQWARVSLANFITGNYFLSQNETLVDFKATASNNTVGQTTGILGDDQTNGVGDALTYRNLLTTSAGLFPAGSFNGPASSMLLTGYVPLNVSAVDRQYDGQDFSANDGTINNTPAFNKNLAWGGSSGTGTVSNPAPDSVLGTAAFNSSNPNFTVGAPGTVNAIGAIYGGNTGGNARAGHTGAAQFTDTMKITTANALLGDFNQTGSRDLAAVYSAVFAQQLLVASGVGTSSLAADAQGSNSQSLSFAGITIPAPAAAKGASFTGLQAMTAQTTGLTGANKGDLIVLGDFNSDGKFDGKDLYLLAEGAAISDASGSGYTAGTLTFGAYNATTGAGGFGDAIRSATLRKNDALDFVNTYSTQQQKDDAQVTFAISGTALPSAPAGAAVLATTTTAGIITVAYTYDAGPGNHSVNAFKKEDVNRDGLIDLNDALVVDHNGNKDYTSLADQLNNGTVVTDGQLRSFSLTDAKLVDGSSVIGTADLGVMATALTGTGNNKWWTGTTTKDGSFTVTFARSAGTTTIESGAALSITAGNLTVNGAANPFVDNSGGPTNGNKLAITVSSGGTLQIGGGIKPLGTLTVNTGGNVLVESATAGHNVLSASSLTIAGGPAAPTAKVILASGSDLHIPSGYTADQTRQLIHAAYSGGTWAGNGITMDALTPNHGLGYLTGADLTTLYHTNTIDGVAVGASEVFVKHTYAGDADLSGSITLYDYAQIDAAFYFQPTGDSWVNGDFNYDGLVDFQDYAIIDAAFSGQGSPLANDMIALHASEFAGTTYLSQLHTLEVAAVPEPATLLLLTLGTTALLRRRR